MSSTVASTMEGLIITGCFSSIFSVLYNPYPIKQFLAQTCGFSSNNHLKGVFWGGGGGTMLCLKDCIAAIIYTKNVRMVV